MQYVWKCNQQRADITRAAQHEMNIAVTIHYDHLLRVILAAWGSGLKVHELSWILSSSCRRLAYLRS